MTHPSASALAEDTGLGFQTSRVLLSVMRNPEKYPPPVRAAMLLALLADAEAVRTLGLKGVVPVWDDSAEPYTYPAWWRATITELKKEENA